MYRREITEIITRRRTLKKRAADVLLYVDHPDTSNGPTEAINGRLEHSRGSVLEFRNRTNCIARSLLETLASEPNFYTSIGMSLNDIHSHSRSATTSRPLARPGRSTNTASVVEVHHGAVASDS